MVLWHFICTSIDINLYQLLQIVRKEKCLGCEKMIPRHTVFCRTSQDLYHCDVSVQKMILGTMQPKVYSP